MQRTLIGVLLGVAFVAALVWTTLLETNERCEVCMEFGGRTACNTSAAGTQDEAVQQAQSSACSQISAGVTQIMRCTAMRPTAVTCE